LVNDCLFADRQDIYLLKMIANWSITEIYENELMRIVAPLSTFCALYNLFLLPILDEEFLKGEAIFSKLELIKMSAYLKDACVGIITLMHPEIVPTRDLVSATTTTLTSPTAGALDTKFDRSHAQISSQTFSLKTKIKAKYFTHLFQV
jgi:hypothetical protein